MQHRGGHPPKIRDRYRASRAFRDRVDFACSHGIPLSVFDGRPVGPGDPVWTPEDQAVALVWQEEQAMRCPGCGHPLDETTDDRHVTAWHAQAVVCHACAAKDLKLARIAEGSAFDRAGVYVGVDRGG